MTEQQSGALEALNKYREAYGEIYSMLGWFLDAEAGEDAMPSGAVDKAWTAFNDAPGDLYWERIESALPHAEGEAVDLDRYDAGVLGSNGGGHVGWWHDYIRAVLEDAHDFYLQQVGELAHPAPQVAVPEGWKLVPVEPTASMMMAFEGWREYDIADHWGDEMRRPYGAWRAMLAAAPTAPAGEPECCRSQPCKRPGTGPCDMPAQQPVSDPDGLPGTKGYWLKDSGYGVDDQFDTLDEALSSASSLIEDYRTEAGADEWPSDADSITISAVTHVARFVHVRDNEYDLRMEPVVPAPEPETPHPMSTAPRDGTMVRLFVQFTNHGVNDGFDSGPAWTIGANTYDDSGDDEWYIAGWNWQQDCFTAGEGEPLGWLPMLSVSIADPVGRVIRDAYRHGTGFMSVSEGGAEHLPRESVKAVPAPDEPIPTILHCPECKTLHVDEGEWATRPHKTHQCQKCGHEWRPYRVPTVGVPAPDEREIARKLADPVYVHRAMLRGEIAKPSLDNMLHLHGDDAQAMKADAERYRWLCDGNGYFMEQEFLCGHDSNKARADRVIDAARAGKGGQQHG